MTHRGKDGPIGAQVGANLLTFGGGFHNEQIGHGVEWIVFFGEMTGRVNFSVGSLGAPLGLFCSLCSMPRPKREQAPVVPQRSATEVFIEILVISILNVAVVYLAAFTYALPWSGVLSVMVFSSLITASVSQFLLTKWLASSIQTSHVRTMMGEGVAVLVVALVSSLAVLIVLARRFNLPMALGISLLSGIISSLLRHLLS
jgi:hypothetical protein